MSEVTDDRSRDAPTGTPFRRQEMLDRFEGDAELLEEIAGDFLERSASLEAQLRVELTRGEAANAGRTAHTLKGLIAYFDRGMVFDCARAVQALADDGDFAGAEALLDSLAARIEELRSHLRREVCRVQ